jgi:hypothetical protein
MKFRECEKRAQFRYYTTGKYHLSQRQKAIYAQWYVTVRGWLRNNHQRFALPLKAIKSYGRTRREGLNLKFSNLNSALSITLSRNYGCCVYVYEDNELWDIIFDSDIVPMRTKKVGWVCAMNYEANQIDPIKYPLYCYPSLALLCEGLMLLPLVAWINEALLQSCCLYMYKTASGSTWASLRREPIDALDQHSQQHIHENNAVSIIISGDVDIIKTTR